MSAELHVERAAPVMAAGEWRTNAEMIADVARLGYLQLGYRTLDPTYGLGNFWTLWRPNVLVRCDLDPAKSPDFPCGLDATAMPESWTGSFDAVVLDPPYKLTGTDAGGGDRYGVHERFTRDDRHRLMAAMLREGTRVLRPRGTLLFRCQDQVEGGRVRWQSHVFAAFGERLGLELVDELIFPSYRPQPAGRAQHHARRNVSQLLVFSKPVRRRAPSIVLTDPTLLETP